MDLNNNSIIFILLGMMGLIGVIGIIALLFRFGATIEVAVLVPIPTGVIAALATAIRRTNATTNTMENDHYPSDNGNKTDNKENINSNKDNTNESNIPVVEETEFTPEHGTVPLSPEYPIDPGQYPEETLNNFSDSEEGC